MFEEFFNFVQFYSSKLLNSGLQYCTSCSLTFYDNLILVNGASGANALVFNNNGTRKITIIGKGLNSSSITGVSLLSLFVTTRKQNAHCSSKWFTKTTNLLFTCIWCSSLDSTYFSVPLQSLQLSSIERSQAKEGYEMTSDRLRNLKAQRRFQRNSKKVGRLQSFPQSWSVKCAAECNQVIKNPRSTQAETEVLGRHLRRQHVTHRTSYTILWIVFSICCTNCLSVFKSQQNFY